MRIIVVTYFLLLSLFVSAQRTPLSTQYMFNKYLMNPAYVGVTNYMAASLNVKQSMIGIDGAPLTEFFSVQFPIQSEYMGVAIRFMHDNIAVTSQNNAIVTYAYQIGIGDGQVALSLEGGLYNYNTDFTNLIIADEEFDPAIPLDKTGQLIPDASFAMYYRVKGFNLGYAFFHLTNSPISFPTTNYKGLNVLTKQQHISVSYDIQIDKGIYFEPLVLTKVTKSSPVQVDVVAALKYKKMIDAGLLYRSGDGIAFMLGFGLKDGLYHLGYSYDFSFSNLGAQTKGGHEVAFQYRLELTPPASQKDLNPIYYID